jgi:hypothetical protein
MKLTSFTATSTAGSTKPDPGTEVTSTGVSMLTETQETQEKTHTKTQKITHKETQEVKPVEHEDKELDN